MSELVKTMKRVSDDYWLYAKKMDWDYVMTLFKNSADLIEKQDRLLGLLREHYTMSYTPDLAPRLDELKKEIDKQIKKEEADE